MKERTRHVMRATTRLAASALAIAGMGAASGCLNRPIEPIDPLTTSVVVEHISQSGVNKIDLVLAVDNSASMADKQAILALAVPDLVNGLVNPNCLDNTTQQPITSGQPTSPTAACPTGSTRDFAPVLDIHIGLISSSLGTFLGPNAPLAGCPDSPPTDTVGETCNTSNTATPLDDHGHLVTRSDACGNNTPIPTFQNEGFLAWNPQTGAPSGSISTVGGIGAGGLIGSVHDLVVGNGQFGCGFESQDESWYRFLIEPTPYGSITLNSSSQAVASGKDTALLAQRAEFLRPDSLLAVILLSDETDTSIKEYSSYPLFGNEAHLPHASAACKTSATDPCCYSCGESAPKGCSTPDAVCGSSPNYTNADENLQIRAFGLIEHKQNYGIEFFYQPSRYVGALTSQTIVDSTGATQPNPIFSNLNTTAYPGATIRDSSLVFYAAIVGVPWQLIARKNSSGIPDLVNGVDDMDKTQVGGFKTFAELSEKDSAGNVYWDDIAGDPEKYVKAISPFMIESTTPRSGKDPITGVSISPTTTPNGTGSAAGVTSTSNGKPVLINDHEWDIPTPAGDIQYACIFSLGGACSTDSDCPQGVNCIGNVCGRDEGASGAYKGSGDCTTNPSTKPLCSPNPNDSMNNTLQTSAKAYPGLKELAIARGMGTQGIAASICPAQLTNSSAADYGYRPAVKAIIDRLKLALHGECLPRQLTENTAAGPSQGQVACLILEGTHVADPTTDCGCTGTARQPVDSTQQPAVTAAEADPTSVSNKLNCFCEISQLCNAGTTGCNDPSGGDLKACQSDPSPTANGWCYIDSSVNADQAALVEKAGCPASDPHNIRFLGSGNAVAGSTLFITCSGD